MDRTICMMEVDPRLIEIRRKYIEKCRWQFEMMRNAYPAYLANGQYAAMQQQSSPSILSDLLGGIGGGITGS